MIRDPAALRLAKLLLTQPICRLEVTDAILDMTAKVIKTFVAADEQAARCERLLGKEPKE